jgi:hypothetical protein
LEHAIAVPFVEPQREIVYLAGPGFRPFQLLDRFLQRIESVRDQVIAKRPPARIDAKLAPRVDKDEAFGQKTGARDPMAEGWSVIAVKVHEDFLDGFRRSRSGAGRSIL